MSIFYCLVRWCAIIPLIVCGHAIEGNGDQDEGVIYAQGENNWDGFFHTQESPVK